MTSCELTSSFHCWSCDYLCVAVIHLPTKLMQIALYNMEFYCILQAILYDIFLNSVYVNLAHSGMLIVLWLSSVPNFFQISVIWDRHTYASAVHLMTSRELTSGLDFWSCDHLQVPVAHQPTKFGADIFIRCGDISISRNSRSPPSATLDLLVQIWVPTPWSRIHDE